MRRCCCCYSVTDGSLTARPLSLFRSSVLQTSRADSLPQCYLSVSFGLLPWLWELAERQNGHSGIPQRSKLTPRTLPRAEVTRRLSANQGGTKKTEKRLILLYIHWPSVAFGCRWCDTQAGLHSLMNTLTFCTFVKAWILWSEQKSTDSTDLRKKVEVLKKT